MGVASSPDLAILYGAYYELQKGIVGHPLVPFYGRYIDDCLAIVYASSEEEAIRIVSRVEFDGCTIEWEASEMYANFLDMTIYKDESLSLHHRPYRKSASHMERIPWISAHDQSVKRGTFLGEMSRLATLSSKFSTYADALRSLAALYVHRGYPSLLVENWLKQNVADKWAKRLNTQPKNDTNDVLVLKSVYNTAWNYFSARELGETVMGFWKTYAEKAKVSSFSLAYPRFSADTGSLTWTKDGTQSVFMTSEGLRWMPDVNTLDVVNRRLITSKKRNRNLFDLASLWKKTVISKMDENILEDDHNSDDMSVDTDSDRSDDIDPNYFIQAALGSWPGHH